LPVAPVAPINNTFIFFLIFCYDWWFNDNLFFCLDQDFQDCRIFWIKVYLFFLIIIFLKDRAHLLSNT